MMRFWKTIVSLAVLLPLSLFAATPLNPPVDPAPIGYGIDAGTPIAVLEMGSSMLAIFEINRGIPKYVTPEIYVRPLDNDGEPTTPAQRFLATGRHGAAAADGQVALIVWIDQGIEAVLVDSAGSPLSAPVLVDRVVLRDTVA